MRNGIWADKECLPANKKRENLKKKEGSGG